ncbi:MAG: hypothetical protein JNK82_35920 [Myxococcaceae bacterium]|nr:hypothetical protein [Myxococcaceae bacterium]
MRRTLMQLFLLLVAPFATEAHAQLVYNPPLVCLQPTLAQCQSPAYRQTACGQQTTANDARDPNSRCNTLIRALLQPGTRSTPQDATKLTASGGTASQLGRLQTLQLAKRNPSATTARNAVNSARTAYAANGAAVSSCDEYVYEKYLGFTQFEDATVGMNRDYRGIAAVAFQTTAPGLNRALLRRDGQPQPAMYFPATKPKNVFIGFVPGPYPVTNIIQPGQTQPTVQRFDWDPQLIARWQAAQGATRGDTFSAHAAAFAELAPQLTDAQWDLALERVEEFKELVAARNRIWSPQLGSTFQPLLSPEKYDALRAADAAIQAALIAAMNDGALDLVLKPGTTTRRLTKYDYHPIDTVRHLSNQFITARDLDLQRCIRNTKNKVSALPAADRANTSALEQYFTTKEGELRQFDTVKKQLTGAAPGSVAGYFIDEEKSDAFERGNGDFAIHADYRFSNRFEWPVTADVEQYCRAKASVHAEFNASGKVFGKNVSIVAVSADAVSQAGENVPQPATFDPYVNVVGIDVWNPATPYDISISFSHDLTTPEPLHAETSVVVLIGPVPVSFHAGVTGQAGLKTSLDLDTSRSVADCRNDHAIRFLNANGVLEPWGYVRGNAGAALGITWAASAGIDVDLLMLEMRAPFTANVWLGIEPSDTTKVKLGGSFSQLLKLGALDGKVTGFVSHPLGTEKLEFFSWDGPRLDVTLFNVPWQYTVQ